MKDVSEKDGRTVLFVSHNMPAVQKLCNKAMVLQFGRNIYAGETDEAINYYLHHKKEEGQLDIEERTDRDGNGQLRCTGIRLLSHESKEIDNIRSGDFLKIAVDYSIQVPSVRSVYFRIQVLDSNEEILFTCNNEHAAEIIPVINKNGTVNCIIPKLPLFGGVYYINIRIFSREAGLMDDVEFAKELTVVDGDFFNTGKIPGVKKGILVMHEWSGL